jgi:hypothetical protein
VTDPKNTDTTEATPDGELPVEELDAVTGGMTIKSKVYQPEPPGSLT